MQRGLKTITKSMLMIKQILTNLCLTGLLTLSIACSNKPAELEVEQTTFDLGDVRFRDGVHHISTSFKNLAIKKLSPSSVDTMLVLSFTGTRYFDLFLPNENTS